MKHVCKSKGIPRYAVNSLAHKICLLLFISFPIREKNQHSQLEIIGINSVYGRFDIKRSTEYKYLLSKFRIL